jgi:hypothetical protein
MRGERIETLLSDLGSGVCCFLKHFVSNLLVVFAVGLACCGSENANGESGITSGRISDTVQLIIRDSILFEAPPYTGSQNIVELLIVVFVHPNVLAGAESTHQAVVDLAEQLLLFVGDTDHRELWEAMEIIDDAGIFELVGLVENYYGS